MKSSPSLAHRFLVPLSALCLFFAVVPRCLATNDDPIREARAAAATWLALIDAGQYDASYVAAGDGLHQIETQAKWDTVLKYMMPGWGGVLSRKESEHSYQPNGIKGLNGECMAIVYDTTFKNLPNGQEMVILRFEDGKWRGVGYTVGPRPSDQPADSSLAPPVTETQTTVHNQPGNNKPINQPTDH